MSTITMLLGIIVGIILEVLYHKLFKVTYFSFEAIFKELFVCLAIGVVLMQWLLGY